MSSHTDLANAIRALSIDAVQQANSGHPGMPMGMADIATVLWRQFLKHNPQNPHWINRDRFVLSNGHGSMLLYSLLHLSGYDLSIDDLKDFRQLESKTPGHPEFGHTPGIETTTGPLGQGIANAVGMAIAEKLLAAEFNADDNAIIDHYTYVFLGDGCLMEGISHEVCSLAGTLQLNKLIAFYDDNGISIDGKIDGWFTDNTALRFQAYGWHVVDNIDGHDPQAIETAIQAAQAEQQRPTIIICKTHIGFGSPRLQDSEKSHGAPLGQDEIAATKKALNWPHEAFVVPEEIYQNWRATERGNDLENSWQHQFDSYAEQFPDKAAALLRRLAGDLPESFESVSETLIQNLNNSEQSDATRKLSQKCIENFAAILPELLGGSADLTGSNNTNWSNAKALKPGDSSGNYLFYGVREFGMSAIMNGIALHGGFIPFGGTFLVFSDYAATQNECINLID
jgi:transketolase